MNGKVSPPQPVLKYCIIIRIIVEVTQYTAKPLGSDIQRNPNMSGIIQSIICPWAAC